MSLPGAETGMPYALESQGWVQGEEWRWISEFLSLDSLPFLVTVADYISRAESQSRQRPPLERTKPSEDSLSGQKVGGQDAAYPTLKFGAGTQKTSLSIRVVELAVSG